MNHHPLRSRRNLPRRSRGLQQAAPDADQAERTVVHQQWATTRCRRAANLSVGIDMPRATTSVLSKTLVILRHVRLDRAGLEPLFDNVGHFIGLSINQPPPCLT